MGAHGPFVIIQNHGANEYIIDSDDLYTREGKTVWYTKRIENKLVLEEFSADVKLTNLQALQILRACIEQKQLWKMPE